MTDPLYDIQQQINQLLPIVLVGPALLITAIGLFIWLGGIRWLKFIAAMTAAVAGLLCAWHFSDRHLIPMVLYATIPVCISFLLYKPIVVCLAGLLTAAILIFVPPAVCFIQKADFSRQNMPVRQDTLNLLESLSRIEEHAAAAKHWVIEYVRSVPSGKKSIALMVGLGVVGAGFFSWRLVCGAACSLLGTFLISVGMLLLLFYKGADPLHLLKQNVRMIGWILIAMIIGGALLQYWLCPRKKEKQKTNENLTDGGHL